jgi:DNA-binding ferritin-like protein
MPVVKKQDGWYWGSKGPFASKQKAIQVGQAAYASGYKEEAMEKNIIGEFVGTLLHSATLTHIKHLQAIGEGSYATHQALGQFYEEIVDLADTLAEAIQGITGTIIDGYPDVFGNTPSAPLEYLKSLKAYVDKYREDMPQASEIQNEIDNIANLINSTIYKLTFLR